MECIIATPLIAHPDSPRAWHPDHDDVFPLPSSQVHKQPAAMLYMPLARTAAPVDTKRRQVRHMRRHTVQNIRLSAGVQKRVRFDRSAVVKPISTSSSSSKSSSSSSSSSKTKEQWEELLKSSLEGLQGIYHKMGTTTTNNNTTPTASTPQKSPLLGDRLPKPDLAPSTNTNTTTLTLLDHTDMAFRALQIAAGSSVSPSQYQAEEYDGDASSGSEDGSSDEMASPLTPRSARMGSEESMELDSGFMGMGLGY